MLSDFFLQRELKHEIVREAILVPLHRLVSRERCRGPQDRGPASPGGPGCQSPDLISQFVISNSGSHTRVALRRAAGVLGESVRVSRSSQTSENSASLDRGRRTGTGSTVHDGPTDRLEELG